MQQKNNHWSNYYTLNFMIGLAFSLSFILSAFEYKQSPKEMAVLLDDEATVCLPVPSCVRFPVAPRFVGNILTVANDDSTAYQGNLNKFFPEWTETTEFLSIKTRTAQEDSLPTGTYTVVEEGAQPTKAFKKYLKKNLRYPKQAARSKIEGKVFLTFIVLKTGELAHVKVIRSIGGGCDEEAVRLIERSPKWKPARHKGKLVNQKVTYPIQFKLI